MRAFWVYVNCNSLRLQIVKWAAFYEHRLQEGSKAIFHIEAFVAKTMASYKQWALTAFA
jgi:replication factor C subunit 3/5